MGIDPRVSIVMPVHNAAGTVEAAIRSLLNQTFDRLEIVVVDDGSADESRAVVEGIRDARVILVRQQHQGIVAALNSGCAHARGEYLARLDADDVAHVRRIVSQATYMDEHPNVGLLGSWAMFESESGRPGTFAPPSSDAALRRYLLRDNPFVHSTVMFRRAAFDRAGGYREGMNEDYRLWVRIARSWQIAVLPQVLVTHRVRGASLSRQMRRTDALRGRLSCQWEAASILGPWPMALPALGVTAGALLLALAGVGPKSDAGRAARTITGRMRGFREGSSGDGRA